MGNENQEFAKLILEAALKGDDVASQSRYNLMIFRDNLDKTNKGLMDFISKNADVTDASMCSFDKKKIEEMAGLTYEQAKAAAKFVNPEQGQEIKK